MRWKGKYSNDTPIAWDVFDDNGLAAYAIKNLDGKWRVRINSHITKDLSPYLILDDDPNVFIPHLLMTLVGSQRNSK
jgi:hypothetical protein